MRAVHWGHIRQAAVAAAAAAAEAAAAVVVGGAGGCERGARVYLVRRGKQ